MIPVTWCARSCSEGLRGSCNRHPVAGVLNLQQQKFHGRGVRSTLKGSSRTCKVSLIFKPFANTAMTWSKWQKHLSSISRRTALARFKWSLCDLHLTLPVSFIKPFFKALGFNWQCGKIGPACQVSKHDTLHSPPMPTYCSWLAERVDCFRHPHALKCKHWHMKAGLNLLCIRGLQMDLNICIQCT